MVEPLSSRNDDFLAMSQEEKRSKRPNLSRLRAVAGNWEGTPPPAPPHLPCDVDWGGADLGSSDRSLSTLPRRDYRTKMRPPEAERDA